MPESDHGITPELVAELSGGMVTADAPGLDAAIDRAVESVRSLCGWHVWPVREDRLRLDTTGGRWVKLPTLRLVELSAVIVDGKPLDLDTVEWSDKGMVRLTRGRFPEGYGRVVVEFRHGFNTPAALGGVVAAIAGRAMLAAGGATLRVGEVSVGATGGGPGGNLAPLSSEWHLLGRYALEPGV